MAIIGNTIEVPYLWVKSLQLTWRSSTCKWNLWVPDLQLSCSDLTTWHVTRKVAPCKNGCQATPTQCLGNIVVCMPVHNLCNRHIMQVSSGQSTWLPFILISATINIITTPHVMATAGQRVIWSHYNSAETPCYNMTRLILETINQQLSAKLDQGITWHLFSAKTLTKPMTTTTTNVNSNNKVGIMMTLHNQCYCQWWIQTQHPVCLIRDVANSVTSPHLSNTCLKCSIKSGWF